MQEDKFEFKKADNYDIKKDKNVRVTKYKNGDYKITDIKKETVGFSKCRRISKDKYIDTETGEIKYYKKNEHKTEQGLANSNKGIKEVIINNFYNGNMLVTTTYIIKGNGKVTIKQAKKDIKAVVKKIRKLKENQEIDYLAIFEMQKNGNVHCHLLLKGVFLLNETVQKLWKKGRTYTQQIDNIEKVASYLSKKKSKEKIENGTRMYIHSKNVTKPPVEKAIYENARTEAEENNCKLVSEYTTLVIDTKTNKIANKIKIERYKKQKNNKKGQVAQC